MINGLHSGIIAEQWKRLFVPTAVASQQRQWCPGLIVGFPGCPFLRKCNCHPCVGAWRFYLGGQDAGNPSREKLYHDEDRPCHNGCQSGARSDDTKCGRLQGLWTPISYRRPPAVNRERKLRRGWLRGAGCIGPRHGDGLSIF
jgi:hypothetical protein